MKRKNDSSSILLQKKPWTNNKNSIWLASTAKLSRNIENFNFPEKLSGDRCKQIISLVDKELPTNFLADPILILADEISPIEKEYLMEHFLASQGLYQAHAGEAFIYDSTGEVLITLNIENHIEFQLTDCNGEIENTWNRLVKIETTLGKSLTYSFSQKYGFLTANPAESGTALVITVFLQPSALIHLGKIDEVLERHADDNLDITGLQGSPTEIVGDILAIRNNYTLGLTEENIISMLRTFTTKLLVEENSTRSHLRQEDHPDLKDKVSRAYGILIHSYQIEAIEALNAISLLKLGADLGWVKGTTPLALNELFFNCRRAHLMSRYKESVEQEQLPHRRTEYIHEALKDVTLAI